MDLLPGHSIRSRMGTIEAHLLAKLADDLVDTHLPRPSPTSDRWVLASQLQKAVRRGHVYFALSAALKLHELDAAYLWRRLRVIAVEDVGLADAELMASIIAVGGKRALHRRLGEVRLLGHVVLRLCESIKNRTACELSCWMDFSPRTAAIRASLAATSADAWVAVAGNGTADVLSRAIAWQLACGLTERTATGFRPWSTFQADAVEALLTRSEIDDTLAYVVMRSRDSEGLAAMLPLAQCYCRDPEVHVEATAQSDSACDAIHGLMAAALCRHTRSGLAAIRLFLRRQPGLVRRLTSAGAASPALALGWLIFQCESGITDRTLDPLPASQLRRHVEDVMMASTGVCDPSAAQSLRNDLRSLLPELNAARADIVPASMQPDLPGLTP